MGPAGVIRPSALSKNSAAQTAATAARKIAANIMAIAVRSSTGIPGVGAAHVWTTPHPAQAKLKTQCADCLQSD
jgi:hypothetical protein